MTTQVSYIKTLLFAVLTPHPDYFRWRNLKSIFYADKPKILEVLDVNINQAVYEIRPEILEKVVRNRTDRMRFLTISRNSHMPEIMFNYKWH